MWKCWESTLKFVGQWPGNNIGIAPLLQTGPACFPKNVQSCGLLSCGLKRMCQLHSHFTTVLYSSEVFTWRLAIESLSTYSTRLVAFRSLSRGIWGLYRAVCKKRMSFHASSSSALNCSTSRASTTLFGKEFQSSTTLWEKLNFLKFSLLGCFMIFFPWPEGWAGSMLSGLVPIVSLFSVHFPAGLYLPSDVDSRCSLRSACAVSLMK